MPASMCDRCYAPGACCRSLYLFRGDKPWTVWQGEADASMIEAGLPFRSRGRRAAWIDGGTGRTYEAHLWDCSALDAATGRCSIYERRPQLCRDLEPLTTPLCVHWNGAEGGEENLPWKDDC
jgi:Fe-S-cluster containining protein